MKSYIKWIELIKEEDVYRIIREVESGNIIIFSCAKLILDENLKTLNNLITRLKNECKIRDLDTTTIGTFRGLVCPTNIKIWRNNLSEERNHKRHGKESIPFVA